MFQSYNFRSLLSLLLLACAISWTSCELEEVPNPNGTDLGNILNDATPGQLQNVVTGVESLLRKEIGFYYDVTSIIGRDYYFFTGSDPRYTGELLGKGDSQLDNAGFYGNRPYSGRYRTVKNCNILIEAANNSTAITDAQRKGYLGFAKTIQAYELLLVANLQYDNGIRIDVSDPDNLGKFTSSYEESLSGIASLLDEATNDLNGAEFNFILSPGFAGFSDASSFSTFTSALAARVAIYRGDKGAASAALDNSFLDLMGDFSTGVYRLYSTAGGESQNPVFRGTNQSDAIIAHPDFVEFISEDDARFSKIAKRDATLSLDDLSGDYDVVVFDSRSASIPLITNEELILIYAEANIGVDNGEAEAALNIIRVGNGLDPVSGLTESELVDEMLDQRRLSLFGQGHRWVDMRRYDRLDELPIDRDGDDVWVQFPRPVTEV